jgi:hypothetical protein
MATPIYGNDAADALHLRVSLGHAGQQALYLRVSPSAASELRQLMEDEGVFGGEIIELSAGAELAVYAASIGGGLTGLATVLRAFFHRNSDKSVKFSYGDMSVDVKGFGQAESERLIDRALAETQRQQLERDDQWRRVIDGGDQRSD